MMLKSEIDDEETFWKKMKGILPLIGGYYVTTVENTRIYKFSKSSAEVEMRIATENLGESSKVMIEIKGDEALSRYILNELKEHGLVYTEESQVIREVPQKPAEFKEIRRKDLETKDMPMPYILPGFYRFYGEILPPLLYLKIKNLENKDRILRVECEVPGYSDKYIKTLNIRGNEEKELNVTPSLNQSVTKIVEVQSASLRYAIYEEDVCLEEQTYPISIYSPLDFMLSIKYGNKEISFYRLLAAWVTPHHPVINEIIKKASEIKKDLTGDGSMGLSDSDDSVISQLHAVYKALKNMELQYINTPVSFGPGFAQRIRYVPDIIKSGGANCVELTILFASVMESIEMAPMIVLVPGHAFFGLKLSSGKNIFLEATMLPMADFEEALKTGEEEFVEHQKNDTIIGIIDIKEMRGEGILPNEVSGE